MAVLWCLKCAGALPHPHSRHPKGSAVQSLLLRHITTAPRASRCSAAVQKGTTGGHWSCCSRLLVHPLLLCILPCSLLDAGAWNHFQQLKALSAWIPCCPVYAQTTAARLSACMDHTHSCGRSQGLFHSMLCLLFTSCAWMLPREETPSETYCTGLTPATVAAAAAAGVTSHLLTAPFLSASTASSARSASSLW